MFLLIRLLVLSICLSSGSAFAVAEEESAWNAGLKQKFFGDKPIAESTEIIELTAPYRAEDPALVPISVTAKIPQTPGKYIKTITLIIDNNPVPFAASFNFTPESGKADIGMRLRFNAYTHIRAIAETNDGKLSMAKAFVKASGGCSAPIATDLEAAKARMGKMKFKVDGSSAQLLISHPNITGMQMDQLTRMIQPAHYVDEIKLSFNGQSIFNAKTDIAISADPNFRFYLPQGKAGELKADIKDTQGNRYSYSQAVTP